MTYDKTIPLQLKLTQEWFGSIIARPIDDDSKINPVSPSGVPIRIEAARYIIPSHSLQPAQRIQIYNQQYWWRLLSTMHEIFPGTTRLFGYYEFNRIIAVPYLTKHAPNHWSLNLLGNRILQWIQEDYTANDKELVYNAAHIDWAFTDSFLAPEGAPLNNSFFENPDEMLDKKLYLQPHVHLFELPYEFFQFRTEFMLQTPEHWLEHDFPKLNYFNEGKKGFYIMHRLPNNDITVLNSSKAEVQLLKQFKEGATIDQVCEWLETQPEDICNEAAEKMQTWFQQWTLRRLLTLEKIDLVEWI